MRVAQIVVEGASEYERKHQRIDAAAGLEIVGVSDADIAHVYAPPEFPASAVRDLRVPYVASGRPKQPWLKHASEPHVVITPENVPEAVEEIWFGSGVAPAISPARAGRIAGATPQSIVGSFGRTSTTNMVRQTLARIHRFRDDIEWHVFNEPPSPGDLASVDAWVDPSVDENDFDGFVAEALVSGIAVVATRTAINSRRTEKGHNAFLVPANDANELAHAILAALFRSEVAQMKIEGARTTASKFRPRQRLRILERIYEEALSS